MGYLLFTLCQTQTLGDSVFVATTVTQSVFKGLSTHTYLNTCACSQPQKKRKKIQFSKTKWQDICYFLLLCKTRQDLYIVHWYTSSSIGFMWHGRIWWIRKSVTDGTLITYCKHQDYVDETLCTVEIPLNTFPPLRYFCLISWQLFTMLANPASDDFLSSRSQIQSFHFHTWLIHLFLSLSLSASLFFFTHFSESTRSFQRLSRTNWSSVCVCMHCCKGLTGQIGSPGGWLAFVTWWCNCD